MKKMLNYQDLLFRQLRTYKCKPIQWNSLVNSEQIDTVTTRFPIGKLWMHQTGPQHVNVLSSSENQPHISNPNKHKWDVKINLTEIKVGSFLFSVLIFGNKFFDILQTTSKKIFNLRKSLFLMTDIAGCLSVCRKYLIGQTWKRQNLIVVVNVKKLSNY